MELSKNELKRLKEIEKLDKKILKLEGEALLLKAETSLCLGKEKENLMLGIFFRANKRDDLINELTFSYDYDYDNDGNNSIMATADGDDRLGISWYEGKRSWNDGEAHLWTGSDTNIWFSVSYVKLKKYITAEEINYIQEGLDIMRGKLKALTVLE